MAVVLGRMAHAGSPGRSLPAALVGDDFVRELVDHRGHVRPALLGREVVPVWRERGRAKENPHARASRHASPWRRF